MKTAAESPQVKAMDAGARWCYYVPHDSNYDGHGFIPSLVVEHVKGHVPMTGNGLHSLPWYWGQTLIDAQRVCEHKNLMLGITERDAAEIVASSMYDAEGGADAEVNVGTLEAE
jgi:hypothetical protein